VTARNIDIDSDAANTQRNRSNARRLVVTKFTDSIYL